MAELTEQQIRYRDGMDRVRQKYQALGLPLEPDEDVMWVISVMHHRQLYTTGGFRVEKAKGRPLSRLLPNDLFKVYILTAKGFNADEVARKIKLLKSSLFKIAAPNSKHPEGRLLRAALDRGTALRNSPIAGLMAQHNVNQGKLLIRVKDFLATTEHTEAEKQLISAYLDSMKAMNEVLNKLVEYQEAEAKLASFMD